MDEKPRMSFLNTCGYGRLGNNIAVQGVTQCNIPHCLKYWEISVCSIVMGLWVVKAKFVPVPVAARSKA
jgi:hypothetical protein